jgi:hypothetical protein
MPACIRPAPARRQLHCPGLHRLPRPAADRGGRRGRSVGHSRARPRPAARPVHRRRPGRRLRCPRRRGNRLDVLATSSAPATTDREARVDSPCWNPRWQPRGGSTRRQSAPVRRIWGRRRHLGVVGSDFFHLFRQSQAFEDAIAFRRARAGTYCADCDDQPGGSRCDDHARDLALIASYAEDARAVSAAIDQFTSGRLAARTP